MRDGIHDGISSTKKIGEDLLKGLTIYFLLGRTNMMIHGKRDRDAGKSRRGILIVSGLRIFLFIRTRTREGKEASLDGVCLFFVFCNVYGSEYYVRVTFLSYMVDIPMPCLTLQPFLSGLERYKQEQKWLAVEAENVKGGRDKVWEWGM